MNKCDGVFSMCEENHLGFISIKLGIGLMAMLLVLVPVRGMPAVIVFDFDNQTGMDLDGLTAGFSEVDGVRLDATTPIGKFNRTGSGFGIDSPGSDDSDAFDGILGTESMTFSFASSGKLVGLEFDRFTSSAGDSFSLTYAQSPTQIYTKSDLDSSNFLSLDMDFLPGENFQLAFENGNGFGLESVTAQMTPVPEPEEYALMASGALLVFALYRRKQIKKHEPCYFK